MTQRPPLSVSPSLGQGQCGGELSRKSQTSFGVATCVQQTAQPFSRKGLKIIFTFYPSNLKTLGINFLLQFQVNKVLGLVKNYSTEVLKYLGMAPALSSPGLYEFPSSHWLIHRKGKKKKKDR